MAGTDISLSGGDGESLSGKHGGKMCLARFFSINIVVSCRLFYQQPGCCGW